MTQNFQELTKNSFSFDPEELVWPETEETWDADEILSQNGMFKFSKIKQQLNMTTSDLTKASKEAKKAGINSYEAYGFGKPKGSQYIVKMSKFRKFYEDYIKQKNIPTNIDLKQVQSVPKTVADANDLMNLNGYFYLKEVCHFSPFRENEDVVKHTTKNQENQEYAKNVNGCWYDETKREYFINMELFVPWFFKSVWVTCSH